MVGLRLLTTWIGQFLIVKFHILETMFCLHQKRHMPDVTVVVKSDLATAAKMHFFSKEAKVFKENVETNGNWLKKFST